MNIFPHWFEMDTHSIEALVKPKSKTVKRREQRKRAKMRNMTTGEINTIMAFGNCGKSIFGTSVPCNTQKVAECKKENPMYVDYVSSDKHAESAKTNYLLSRAVSVKEVKRQEFWKQFGLGDDTAPATAKDLVARITSGKYILPTERETELLSSYYWGSSAALNGIKWRDPSVKEDRAGYDAATKALDVEFQKVQDQVMIADNASALTTIQAFEGWTYTPAA